MATKKEGESADVSEKYIKWLSELSAKSGAIAGGKGANLAEMYNAGFPVPPAFIVTAQAFASYIKEAGLKEKIKAIIDKTNVDDTAELEKNAVVIRKMIENAKMPEDMEQEIIEAYHLLSTEKYDDILKESQKENKEKLAFVAVRSSANVEDLPTASFAGQQETYTNVRGEEQLIEAVKKCFASLFTARAVYYRHKRGFEKANALLAVVVQRMINSEKSGVVFTKNPITKKDEVVIEAVFGLGEGIVSGKILPDHYIVSKELEIIEKKIADKKTAFVRQADGSEKQIQLPNEKSKAQVLTNSEIKALADISIRIEKHYKKPQDIEFAVESGKIYIVQSRPITTLEMKREEVPVSGNVLLTGLPASPGIASGKVKLIWSLGDLSKIKQGDVLVTRMTNPDMVVTMQKSVAVVTDEGGMTAHAAIVSREMGLPCVVGTEKATKILRDGMLVTVDGTNGKVYEGMVIGLAAGEGKKEILPIAKGTKTKIKVIVDLPDFASRAAKTECDSVGLLRIEGIIASSGKHPVWFLKENKLDEYSKIIEKGISKIAQHFKELWIRTSDIRSDEFRNLQGAPKEVEANPMLGLHGIRFGLKNLPVLEAELSAIKRTAEKYPEKSFGIMFPQVISEEEIAKAYKLVHERYHSKNVVIGAMIETPAAVQVIRGLCKYAKFISFGTNDLTQYTLAIDRGNASVQYLYDEMNPAVLLQLRRVIRICKEYNVETSICGQAGSQKDMVRFLVGEGIDSISINADAAKEISEYVAELEKQGIRGKGSQINNYKKD